MSLGFAIVDAHQHFWDPTRNYHPWLCDEPPIAFRYGDYRSLRRPVRFGQAVRLWQHAAEPGSENEGRP